MKYVVQKGDTLYSIARRTGTTVKAILVVNPQIKDPNMIYEGQVINIPKMPVPPKPTKPPCPPAPPTSPKPTPPKPTKPPCPPAPPPPPSPPGMRKYVVRKGDTLSSIARRFNVTVEDILKVNPQIKDPNLIYPGQVIIIPGGVTPPIKPTPVPPSSPPSGSGIQYVIQRGDTLTRIARRFGVTVKAILVANPQITNANIIFPGQIIIIPT